MQDGSDERQTKMSDNTYRLMITSLYGGGPKDTVEYFYAAEGEKNIYCDAMLSAEASCKYMLAKYRIDEIVTLGSKTTYDPGDELVKMVLREGASFYSSDTNKMSAYSLLRYRLAQYLDELRIEEQDLRELLPEEERRAVTDAFTASFRKNTQGDAGAKLHRAFDMINRDEALKYAVTKDLLDSMKTQDAGLRTNQEYRSWVLNWLYGEMRDSAKMEALGSNSDVKIRFIPTDGIDAFSFAGRILESFIDEAGRLKDDTDLELYICIQSEDADDTYALMSIIDIINAMPGSRIRIACVVTSAHEPGEIASDISDSTELYGASELVAGARSFLRSGKTDILVNYWNQHRTDNEYIDRLLNAMRNIDIGISLCDISDIERGIASLRRLFAEEYTAGSSIVEQYFGFIILAIKEDYGKLLEGDRIEPIELIKWAYRKSFWQQTLTLIESKVPQDFVDKGIYYYSDGERSKEQAVRVFGEIYYNLKQHEKYKLDDIDHYYVKFYGRGRIRYTSDDEEHLQKYTALRLDDLHTSDRDIIRAHTDCPDEDALGSLLYAYYKVGNVRNETNHASGGDGAYTSHMEDSDVSDRMSLIRRSVESFIYAYDKVISLIGEDGGKRVVRVTHDEIVAYANTLKPKFGNKGDRRDGGSSRTGDTGKKDGSAEAKKTEEKSGAKA